MVSDIITKAHQPIATTHILRLIIGDIAFEYFIRSSQN